MSRRELWIIWHILEFRWFVQWCSCPCSSLIGFILRHDQDEPILIVHVLPKISIFFQFVTGRVPKRSIRLKKSRGEQFYWSLRFICSIKAFNYIWVPGAEFFRPRTNFCTRLIFYPLLFLLVTVQKWILSLLVLTRNLSSIVLLYPLLW